jgi:hypothetical protein
VWTDVEDGLPAAAQELRRLFRRARARPLLTLGLALAVASLGVLREARVRFYQSRVVFRIEGAERTSNRSLRRLVESELLTDEALLPLMRRHHLDPTLVEENPLDALEWLRADVIGLEVWHSPEAHLAVAFVHKDPRVAYDAVCDLSELISARTENPVVARADRDLARADKAAAAAREELFAARSALSLKEMKLRYAVERAKLIAEIESLREEGAARERRLAELQAERDAARIRAQAARRQPGLRFEVVEPPQPAPLVAPKGARLVELGFLGLLLLLPLAAMAVGAYDPVVRDAADLKRLGQRPLGHVPAFPGDGVGSLDEREKRMRYTGRG